MTKKRVQYRLGLFLAVAGLLTTGTATAATNYWDTNGATEGFGTASGTWGVDAFWSGDATGLTLPTVIHTTTADDLIFGTRQRGLATGAVTVEGTQQAFRSLRFGAASGPVTITGGTLTPAAPLTSITVENSSNTLASALIGDGGIRLAMPPLLTATNFLTAAYATLFMNATLGDAIHAGGILEGASVSRQPANAYHFTNNGATVTFQLQAFHSGFTKCVKVELAQSGSDITGRALYAKNLANNNLGFDFDTGGTLVDLAEDPAANGYGVAQTILLPTPHAYEPFVTTTAATLFPGVSLADVREVGATFGGGSVSGPGRADTPTPFYFQNDGTTATLQMQVFNGNYTKCVKLELTQDGVDIKGRVLYAKYYNAGGKNVLGYDFDTGGNVMSVATSFGTGSYGLCQLRLYEHSARRLRLTGTNTFTGGMTIDLRGQLEIADGGCLGGASAVYSGTITNHGLLYYNNVGNQTLAGSITGTGALIKDSSSMQSGTVTCTNFLTLNDTVLFTNLRLANCTGVSGLLGGTSICHGTPTVPEVFHLQRTDTQLSCQFQLLDNGYTKCVKIILTQNGPIVLGRAAYAKYIAGNDLGFNFDDGGSTMSLATKQNEGGYGVAETTLETVIYSTLTLSGTNSYTGGTTVRLGTLRALASAYALPDTGGITVEADSELVLEADALTVGNSGGVGFGNPITVLAGGMLTLASPFNAGYSRPIILQGGTLNGSIMQNNDSANYINNLTLQDGARVIGHKIRVGYNSAAMITVGGTAPSSLEAGINMAKIADHRPLTLDVADVTGDDAVDFSMPGEIRDYDSNHANMPLVKNGAGTMSFSSANTFWGPVTINAGTLALDAAGALNPSNTVTLAGGTLAMGSHSNAVGTLALAANSTLLLGAGHLAFAASQDTVWTNGCTLTLVGELGARSVRIGTGTTSLTPVQLAAITYNGKSVRLTSLGYLSPHSGATIISLR